MPGARPLYTYATTSILAVSLQILALSIVVYDRTGSALWSGAAFAAGFMPQLIGGLLLTSLADRWRARPLLVAAALVRTGSMCALAFAPLSPAGAIGLVALVAVFQPVPSAAQSALVTRLFTGELYVLGRSVFSLISSGAQLLGLAIGGTLVALTDPSTAFAIAAIIHLLAALAAWRLPRADAIVVGAARWSLTETWRANGELMRNHAARTLLFAWWVPATLVVGAESLVVVYVADSGLSPGAVGWLLGAFPAGAAIGDLVIARWIPPRTRNRLVPWLFLLVGIALLPLAIHPGPVVAFACFLVASAAGAYQLGGQQRFLDVVPEQRRGVAFGLFGTGLQTGQGIGPVVAGLVADQLGAPPTIALLGAGVVVVAPWLARLPAAPARQVTSRVE